MRAGTTRPSTEGALSHAVTIAGSGETFMVGAGGIGPRRGARRQPQPRPRLQVRHLRHLPGEAGRRRDQLPRGADGPPPGGGRSRLCARLPGAVRDRPRHRGRGPAGARRRAGAAPRDRPRRSGASSPDVTHLTLELPGLDSLQLPPRPACQHPDGGRAAAELLDGLGAEGQPLRPAHPAEFLAALFTDGRLPALAEGEDLDVELPLGSFFLRKAGLPAPAHGRDRHRPRADQEHPRIADGGPDDCPPSLLYWGTREPNGLYLHDDIATWSERLSEFEYRPVLSRGGAGLGRPAGLCPGRGPQPTSKTCPNTRSISAARRPWWRRRRRSSSSTAPA